MGENNKANDCGWKDFTNIVKETSTVKERNFKISNSSKESQNNLIEDVVLFFSFDVVNSTLYKTINYFGWYKVINSFFLELQDRVTKKIIGSELWRILGDEAIFIVRIKELDEIVKYVDIFYTIFLNTLDDLNQGVFFSLENRDLELERRQNVLSLKATSWIALVSNNASGISEDSLAENVFVTYNASAEKDKYLFYEFLGNDIDAGFRVAEYTRNRRLALSFELACILNEYTKESYKLNIITYKRLKGVWKGDLYPIIWYHDKSKCHNEDLEENFNYDEMAENDLVQEYYINRSEKPSENKLPLVMYTNVTVALTKIAHDRNLISKINKIKSTIPLSSNSYDYINNRNLELHCATVCFRQNKILIVEMAVEEISTNIKKCWGFGCAKASKQKNLVETIKTVYKQSLGIDIEIVTDTAREDIEPIPLAIYQMEKENNLHKGIVFLASIENDVIVEDFKANEKYFSIKWIKEDEIESFNEESVPDFKDTLNKAFQKIKEIEKWKP